MSIKRAVVKGAHDKVSRFTIGQGGVLDIYVVNGTSLTIKYNDDTTVVFTNCPMELYDYLEVTKEDEVTDAS